MTRRWFLPASLAPLLPAAGPVPRPAGDYSVDLPGKPPIKLSQYKGKVLAVEFLLTYCGACQAGTVTLQKMYAEFAPKGFQAIGVAVNDSSGKLISGFLQATGATFPVGMGSQPSARAFLQLSEQDRMLMPQLVFIDRQGTIRAQYSGDNAFFKDGKEMRMRMQIAELLAPARR